MSITNQQKQNATIQQHSAAHDSCKQVRLIAGPGSGKSFAIQERVRWLLDANVMADRIFVISFTRAASRDLKDRVIKYCIEEDTSDGDRVNVSTLHSLALRALGAAGQLTYPANPLVLDNWELDYILDKEFSLASGHKPGGKTGRAPKRCKAIRGDYEAFCSTGNKVPPNYVQPDPPINNSERKEYLAFHMPRTQLYSCVLPGEIVRDCVTRMRAGTLNPASLLNIEQLIIDEYQDLNPVDLEFVDRLIDSGVPTFVAGDDDQSIYSFRYASPQGIQEFTDRYLQAGDHQLRDCFRCTPRILTTGQTLMSAFADPMRITKDLTSLYESSDPPEIGSVHLWRFSNHVQEDRAIASSCKELINSGLPPREIMVLVSNTRTQLHSLLQALEVENVEYESPRTASFIETQTGRFILALLRIVSDHDDYIAYRLVMGLLNGVGPSTCNQIAEIAVVNIINYKDLFHKALPSQLFQGRQLTALNRTRLICNHIYAWNPDDALINRINDISAFVLQNFNQQEVDKWLEHIAILPQDINLGELLSYFWADTDEQKAMILETVYTRLSIPKPTGGLLPQKIRIMTMHGAKGLSSTVVFIPGLEESIFPGSRRQPYPGLILEAARQLYVSITRARAGCFLTYSDRRMIYGRSSRQSASRFTAHLGASFSRRNLGLDALEAEKILETIGNL